MATHAPAPVLVATRSPRRTRVSLALASVVVVLLGVGTLALFALAVPARIHELASVCRGATCAVGQVRGGPGVSPPGAGYVAALIGGEITYALVHVLLASLIFWRRGRQPMALFVAGMLVLWGLTFPPTLAALGRPETHWFWPVACASFLGAAAITLFFYIFPDGHFRPRWAGALAALWVGAQIPRYFFPDSRLDFQTWSPALLAVVSAGFLGVMVALQVVRYRHFSDANERRQTKWVVFGIVCALLGYAALLGVAALLTGDVRPGTSGFAALSLGEEAAVALLPICIGIAILRARLYDIDLLLNRALVYGTLTVMLTTLYFVVVIGLQEAAQALTHQTRQSEPLVIVLSTLAIATAFQPLRSRLQREIDRRFFRTRYDATRLLMDLARAIHNEVDLEALTGNLVHVVEQAFEPAHISLWLRSTQQRPATSYEARPSTPPPEREDWSRMS